jgi:pyruvate dehydrogenase complex dehydrogenase (E1) component
MKDHERRQASDNPKLAVVMEAIITLCKWNGVSISHEDSHGGFIFEDYSEKLEKWFREASDETTKREPF